MIQNYLDSREYMENLVQGMPPLIISVAITGGVAGKEVNPNLPETPEEQADSTYEAYKAGASIVHIHARDPEKGYAVASSNPDHYHKINKLIRERCPDVVIANTTGASADMPRSEAIKSLNANPEMASLNCGPLILRGKLKKRHPPLSGRDQDLDLGSFIVPITFNEPIYFAQEMKKRGIKPELEVYHCQMYNVVDNLIRHDLLVKPYSFSLIFADGIAHPPTIQNFIAALSGLPKDSIFQTIGVGPAQLPVHMMSILIGGNIRVGFEDNVFYKQQELLKSNAQAVERVVRIAEEFERPIATPVQTREILGLPRIPSAY